jgi:hypothetical protein
MNFKTVITTLLFLICFSCGKKSKNISSGNPVPSVPVQIRMYPNDVSNFNIQGIGGFMYIGGGIRGIILYRKSQDEFVAMERTSTALPNDDGAIVKVQSNNFTLRDTVSNSEWRIVDGGVTKGPAEYPLRQYLTSYDGNLLLIRN